MQWLDLKSGFGKYFLSSIVLWKNLHKRWNQLKRLEITELTSKKKIKYQQQEQREFCIRVAFARMME